jgi:hypothetical protein
VERIGPDAFRAVATARTGNGPTGAAAVDSIVDAVKPAVGGGGTYAQIVRAQTARFPAASRIFPTIRILPSRPHRKSFHVRGIGRRSPKLNENHFCDVYFFNRAAKQGGCQMQPICYI